MIVELNTGMIDNIFSGTYETIWEVREDETDDGKILYPEYDKKDLIESIKDAYQANKEDFLELFKDIDFIIDLDFKGFYSPREYDFKTDELDIDFSIDEFKLVRLADSLKNDGDFNKYLRDRYSSYDGFMSFTPNNYKEFAKQIKTMGYESDQAISSLINYLIDGVKPSLELDTYYYWSENDYCGLDYEYIEE